MIHETTHLRLTDEGMVMLHRLSAPLDDDEPLCMVHAGPIWDEDFGPQPDWLDREWAELQDAWDDDHRWERIGEFRLAAMVAYYDGIGDPRGWR